MDTLGIKLRNEDWLFRVFSLMSILSCLELVGHHMEADVRAAANISLYVKSFHASLWQAITLSWLLGECEIKNKKLFCYSINQKFVSLFSTVPRLELKKQSVFSQLRKLPSGNSSHLFTLDSSKHKDIWVYTSTLMRTRW